MEIRDATEEDWPEIWPFFREIVEAGETIAYPLGMTSEQGHDLWFEPGPDRVIVAAAADNSILGTAKFGANRPGRGSQIGTATFMVAPAARRQGVGRALGEHVVAELGRAGFAGIQFNAVVETNATAVRLWTSLGFSIIGTVPAAFDHPAHGRVGLHVMHRPL